MALCVLTGDIVGSTGLTHAQQDRVQFVLNYAHSQLRVNPNGRFDTFRGDGWQMGYNVPAVGLRYALYVRACLKADSDAFETRIAIAEGHETPVLSHENSNTYVASGRALDDMPRDVLMAHASGGPHHATTVLADHISRGWTVAQARAVEPFLRPHQSVTQKDVAAQLAISRQAVGQALDAAGYPVLIRALRALEEQAK